MQMSRFAFQLSRLGALFAIMSAEVLAQEKQAPLPKGRVAWLLEDAVDQAGERMRKTNQERWTGIVEVRGPKNEVILSGVKLTMQWPGNLAMEVAGKAHVFSPGTKPGADIQPVIADVAEMLQEDTLDGFLALHHGIASSRIVGSGYPAPAGMVGVYDVISLLIPMTSKDAGGSARSKMYWFDRSTKRLVRIGHEAPGVEVRAEDWNRVQNNEFAGTLTLYSQGAVKYVVKLVPTGVGPTQNDGLFDGR